MWTPKVWERSTKCFLKNWTISIQVLKRVVHWNFSNNINSEFLRLTIVSFESFKVHMSLKTPSFLVGFFQKHMTKHGFSWPIITFRWKIAKMFVGWLLKVSQVHPKSTCLLEWFNYVIIALSRWCHLGAMIWTS